MSCSNRLCFGFPPQREERTVLSAARTGLDNPKCTHLPQGGTAGQSSTREAGTEAAVPLIISQALHPAPPPRATNAQLNSFHEFPLLPSQSCWQPLFLHQTWPSCVHKRNTEKSVATAHGCESIISKAAFPHLKLCLDGLGSHEQHPAGFCPNPTS